jgi:hypothetical protein
MTAGYNRQDHMIHIYTSDIMYEEWSMNGRCYVGPQDSLREVSDITQERCISVWLETKEILITQRQEAHTASVPPTR